jgi:uncharacterized membrane protein YeiH
MGLTESVFYILELTGTIAFAVSGAMVAIERRLDIFGVVFLGMTTAVGGGIVRDMLIGCFPPMAFVRMEYVLIACGVSLAVFLIAYFARRGYFENARRIDDINNIFDAVGLGAFAVSGTRVGIVYGFGENAFLCVFLGLLTGIGGGLLRDVMSRSIPFVLRKRVYAIAALAGSTAYYLLSRGPISDAVAIFAGLALTCLIRILATVFCWDLPVALPLAEAENKRC